MNALDQIFTVGTKNAAPYPQISYPAKSFFGAADGAPSPKNMSASNLMTHRPTAIFTLIAVIVGGIALWHWNYLKA